MNGEPIRGRLVSQYRSATSHDGEVNKPVQVRNGMPERRNYVYRGTGEDQFWETAEWAAALRRRAARHDRAARGTGEDQFWEQTA